VAAASERRITWGLGRAVAIASSPWLIVETPFRSVITQKYQALR